MKDRIITGPGQESVWDFPRPPRVEQSTQHVRVEFSGTTIAETRRPLRVLETSHPPTYYIPKSDVRLEHLQPDSRRSMCEYKGQARYYELVVGGYRLSAVAWEYPDPWTGFERLRDHLCFYPSRMDACYVDGERVQTQEGDFYGGWITSRVVGPFKGGPATMRCDGGGYMKAIDAIGGSRPLATEEFAIRAYESARNPLRNPVKSIMDRCSSVQETPPMLGIFNDIPWHQFRESEAHAWARAGVLWIVNDGEHNQWEGYYGRDQNLALLRLGLLPVQRLPREAVSTHGDALQLGARATMRPYATQYQEAQRYVRSMSFPRRDDATPDDRGGYAVRGGDRMMYYNPDELRRVEEETQGWLQFETLEYILDLSLRDRVLDLLASQGANRFCVFVGPFDAALRGGGEQELRHGITELFGAAAARGIYSGRLVSPGPRDTPGALEDAMVVAIEAGARLLTPHVMTSDLTYRGAEAVAEPFFRACRRCGF